MITDTVYPMTDRDFQELRRYPNGDIFDLAAIYPFLTDEQVLDLTPDDADRVEEWSMADTGILDDVLVEFGISARVAARFDREFEAAA